MSKAGDRWRLLKQLVGVLMSAAVLTGCSTAAGTDKTRVVAGIYPYAFLAERIGGSHVEVVDLTRPGVEPHDLELSPQQIAQVVDSDLLVGQRGFQPAFDDAVAQSPARALDVSDVVRPTQRPAPADPHVWLDPVAMAEVARALASELASADPENAAEFGSNARHIVAQLRSLDGAYRRGLAHCERTSFVTSHAAFGHLARRYDLRMVAVAGLDPHAEPPPRRQAELVDVIEASGVTTVFTEPLTSPAIAESLADEAGVSVSTLDPIEGLATETTRATYFSLMRANLRALREANGCR